MKKANVFVALVIVSTIAMASEAPSERKVADVLPPDLVKGSLHTVIDPVASDGYLDSYQIESQFGTAVVIGRAQLRAHIIEIAALNELDQISKTKEFVDAAAAAGIDMVKSISHVFTDPIETFTGLPKGVGRLFSRTKTNVQRGFRKAGEIAKGESPTDAAAMVVRNSQISRAERSWAKKLGVDPYSTNLVLRDAIGSVALVDSAASFTVGLAIPGLNIGLNVLGELADEVWSMAPSELEAKNRQRFGKAGFSDSNVDAIIDNIWYTPTWQTVLASSAATLEGVENIATIATSIMSVGSYDEARFVMQIIAMLAWYHAVETPLASIIDDPQLPHAVDMAGRHVALFPIDHLFATEQTTEAADRLRSAVPSETHHLWITGTTSAQAATTLQRAGWMIEQNTMSDLVDRLQLR